MTSRMSSYTLGLSKSYLKTNESQVQLILVYDHFMLEAKDLIEKFVLFF